MASKYIKILTDDMKHRNYQWKIGRNDLPEHVEFNESEECTDNALYICHINNLFEWINLYPNMKWVSYATIPDNAKSVDLGNKIKVNSIVLHEPLIAIEDFIPIAVQHGADINTTYYDTLEWAIRTGRVDIVRNLIEKYNIGISINYVRLIHMASDHDDCLEVMKYLLEKYVYL